MKIPVIDISKFELGSKTDKDFVALQIDEAARNLGFMQLSGHGLNANHLEELQCCIEDFFSLPLNIKERCRSSDPKINRGYTPPLTERLSYSIGVDSPPDLFEAFNMGSAWTDYPQLSLDPITYPINIWPDRPKAFREGIQRWFDVMVLFSRRVTRMMAYTLDLPLDFFTAYEDHSLDVLRLNVYAANSVDSVSQHGQMGMGAHTDYGIVTVLWADPVEPGLQVLGRDGRWRSAIPEPGNLLINIGDLLARWTNDRWLSSLHRVSPPVNSKGQVVRRRSAAFFHDGNADAIVSCLPNCTGPSNPARYEPITVAEHIREKLNGSRGLSMNTNATSEGARLLSVNS